MEQRNTEHRRNGGTAEHPETVVKQLNITRSISGTSRNNGAIQNEEQCF